MLEKISKGLNRLLAVVGGTCMLLMIGVVVVNSVSRVVYKPFIGTSEVVSWLTALTVAFALGYTQIHRGYVDIDVLVERLPLFLQKAVKSLVLLAGTVFFGMTAGELFNYGFLVKGNGNLSETLEIIFFPFIFLVGVGFIGLTLALLADLIKLVTGGDPA